MRFSFRIRLLALSLFIGALSGCQSTPAQMSPAQFRNPVMPTSMMLPAPFSMPRTVQHEVGPAETLWRISKTYDVDMKEIMRVNNISDPEQIQNGQVLTIPHTLGPVPVIPLYPSHKWTHIVIHHTATETGNARSIQQIHLKRGFWNGMGYHFLIDNGTFGKYDGQIEIGPRWIKQEDGAHCNANDMNQRGIGIALVGNYSIDRVSERSLNSLVYLVKTLQNYYEIPDSNVIGHRDVPGKNTECPGNYFPWTEFKRRLTMVR